MTPSETAGPCEPATELGNRVAELLAGYLLSAGQNPWPGTDGLTVAEAVTAFYQAAALVGRVPDAAELARRHPELAAGIAALLAPGGSPADIPVEQKPARSN